MAIKSANASSALSSSALPPAYGRSAAPPPCASQARSPWAFLTAPDVGAPVLPIVGPTRSEPGLLPTPAAYPVQEPTRITSPRDILLSNLPHSADAKVIYDLVTPYGPIETMEAHMHNNSLFVTFREAESAQRAVRGLSGTVLFNSRIRVTFGGAPVLSAEPEPTWAGFLTKTAKDRCQVDLFQLKGDCSALLRKVHELRVTHRARLEEVTNVKPCALGLLATGDSSNGVARFVAYLRQRNRAGFVKMKNFSLFLVPRGSKTDEFRVNMKDNELLAVFTVDNPSNL